MVLGVDTHNDVHVAAVITVLGVLLAGQSFPATAAGYRQLLGWARMFGPARRAGVECTGSYGEALTRYLRAEGVAVIEVNQPDKPRAVGAGRPTPWMPSPLRGPCSRVEPPRWRRPATGRWR